MDWMEALKRLKDAGKTDAAIAYDVGCSSMSVYKWRHEYSKPLPSYRAALIKLASERAGNGKR